VSSVTALPTDTPGREFERRVADAYRALGYQLTANIRVGGKQTDLLARRQIEGAPTIVLAVECRDSERPVGNGDIFDFVARVIVHRNDGTVTGGVLVSSNGFTADARGAAAGHDFVRLLSWDELASEILDVRHQMGERVAQYEASEIYHEYVSLSLFAAPWGGGRVVGRVGDDLLETWMGGSDPKHTKSLFVLADFGAGKTTVLRRFEYERARAYLVQKDTRVPLFVPLRAYRESHDVMSLLRGSFRDAYYRDLPSDLLWRRVQEGQFYLLLDGFDEMVERSDAARRLELFYALLPLLRSRSPTLVTSRPGYFVEPDELDNLLTTLRRHETVINASARPSSSSSLAADRLRRKLVRHNRESRPSANANDGLSVRDVVLADLLPLDEPQIRVFLDRRAARLERVDTTPAAVMDFILRTYDLSDLASRPMLLNLIVESVALGELDISDKRVQFGASGLYDVYTDAKLAFDLDKGGIRQDGLSLETRRQLAEELAVKMYCASTLESDFHELFADLMTQVRENGAGLETGGLSEQEIATDFATCSFVTLDQDGRCRFVHKSFRGFFVARVLRARLRKPHALLSEWLEREVLYFLGGFAPTEPVVGEQLWGLFRHTDPRNATLRRNVLVAFLYTRPEHDSRRIATAEIAEAEFGRLTFRRSLMVDVRWSRCAVRTLELIDARWRGVRFLSTRLNELRAHGGELDLALEDVTVEDAVLDGVSADLIASASTIHRCSVDSAEVRITGEEASFGQLTVARSRLDGAPNKDGADVFVERLEVADSRVSLNASWDVLPRATRSAFAWHGPPLEVARWTLEQCAVVIEAHERPPENRSGRRMRGSDRGPDERTVILPRELVAHELLTTLGCGVFGAVEPGRGRARLPKQTTAWGVLRADWLLPQRRRETKAEGCREGRLLLVDSAWYERETADGGRLSGVGDLVLSLEGDAWDPVRLVALLELVRGQHRALLAGAWEPVDLR
jgi:hypothetical protein